MKTLIFSPGLLTRDFVDGKRTRYISPLRLYLTWSVVFFSLILLFGSANKLKYTIGPGDKSVKGVEVDSGESLEGRLKAGAEKAKHDPEKMGEAIVHSTPKAMFILMPFFAAVVMLFYRKAQRFYIPHLYFSIHLHAFAFFLLSLSLLLGATNVSLLTTLGGLFILTLVPYFIVSLHTVYGGGWGVTVAKGVAMAAIYVLLFAATMVGVVMLSLLTV